MRAVWSSLAALGLCSCIGFNLGTGSPTKDAGATSDAGTAGDSSATATSDAGAPTPAGVDCGQDPYTGAVLCTGISACPGLLVDHDVYPDCGFRPNAGVLDLECACSGELCPIGVATTCAQAAALMDGQTEYQVCVQVNEGRCTTQ